jgi:hypothetical protein
VERLTGYHWAWAATIAVGVGQVAWIVCELFMLPEVSWLQALYGPLGLALAITPLGRTAGGYFATSWRR